MNGKTKNQKRDLRESKRTRENPKEPVANEPNRRGVFVIGLIKEIVGVEMECSTKKNGVVDS
jgi:hypothetical protein